MKHLKATDILELLHPWAKQEEDVALERFQATGALIQHPSVRLEQEAPIRELLKALQQSQTAFQRQILCDLLGKLHARSAVDELITCLTDNDPSVQTAAADALAKIGSPRAGEPLLACFLARETDPALRSMLAAALGAVSCRAAIPALIEALSSPDQGTRGAAAWSLGALQAKEAQAALEQALQKEAESYPQARMQAAYQQLQSKT